MATDRRRFRQTGDLHLVYDITLLIKAGLLKPLGRPKPNSDKYFAAVKLAELRQDEQWLSRATLFISQHWKDKNARKSQRRNGEMVTAGR